MLNTKESKKDDERILTIKYKAVLRADHAETELGHARHEAGVACAPSDPMAGLWSGNSSEMSNVSQCFSVPRSDHTVI